MNALFIFFSRLSRRTQNFSSVAAGTAHPKSPAHLSSPDSQAPPVREFIRVHSCPFVPLEPRRGLSNYPTQHTPEPCPLIQSGTGILPVTSHSSDSPKWHGHPACDLSRQHLRRRLSHCLPMGSCCQSRWFGYCERKAVISIEFQAVGRKRRPAERPVCRWIFHQI